MIPLATTSITITRVANDPARDGYDTAPAPTQVAQHVRAHLSSPSGSTDLTGGQRVSTRWTLLTDPVDLRPGDVVLDETTSQSWHVLSTDQRVGLGLDHMHATVNRVDGAR